MKINQKEHFTTVWLFKITWLYIISCPNNISFHVSVFNNDWLRKQKNYSNQIVPYNNYNKWWKLRVLVFWQGYKVFYASFAVWISIFLNNTLVINCVSKCFLTDDSRCFLVKTKINLPEIGAARHFNLTHQVGLLWLQQKLSIFV